MIKLCAKPHVQCATDTIEIYTNDTIHIINEHYDATGTCEHIIYDSYGNDYDHKECDIEPKEGTIVITNLIINEKDPSKTNHRKLPDVTLFYRIERSKYELVEEQDYYENPTTSMLDETILIFRERYVFEKKLTTELDKDVNNTLVGIYNSGCNMKDEKYYYNTNTFIKTTRRNWFNMGKKFQSAYTYQYDLLKKTDDPIDKYITCGIDMMNESIARCTSMINQSYGDDGQTDTILVCMFSRKGKCIGNALIETYTCSHMYDTDTLYIIKVLHFYLKNKFNDLMSQFVDSILKTIDCYDAILGIVFDKSVDKSNFIKKNNSQSYFDIECYITSLDTLGLGGSDICIIKNINDRHDDEFDYDC